MKILIAEDDPISRRVLEVNLLEWGYEVMVASDGSEAWEIIQQHESPSLIISDWMMPGMSGIEVLQNLRKTPKTASIPVYMLTAKGKMGDAEKAFAAGADGYFTKPIDLKELSERLRRRLDELGQ